MRKAMDLREKHSSLRPTARAGWVSSRQKKGADMYIGIGTVLAIIIIILLLVWLF
jgi:hypothetical protein